MVVIFVCLCVYYADRVIMMYFAVMLTVKFVFSVS